MTAWDTLARLSETHKDRRITGLFDSDPDRFSAFSCRFGDLLLDFSKTNLDADILTTLIDLTRDCGLEARRDAMFSGKKINETEDRAVLHTALRNLSGARVDVDGEDVMPEVLATLDRMAAFCTAVRSGQTVAANGAAFTDVVNIGIGGSDLGPAMAALALAPYHDGPRTHFIANVDGADLTDTLAGLDPATTLVIVASKTFTTIETMTNAAAVRDWLQGAVDAADLPRHLVALSSNVEKAGAFGVLPERVFGFEDWVGGRYSVWGPIGLSLMLAIGPDRFREFLSGAEAMDRHFQSAPLSENLPVILALIGIWHANICGHDTRAVLPYDQRLARLPAYLQQLDMESNGKGVAMDGTRLSRASGPIVWGEPGTNGQHAFYQLIHQGTRVIPAEFLVARQGHEPQLAHQHRLLLANCLAQAEALMVGRGFDAAQARMADKGLEGAERDRQAAHRVFDGNRPSTILLYDRLTPATLGKILALYEHRVFVEGVIWGINSFDQWGVELGKELATGLLPMIEGDVLPDGKDGSTAALIGEVRGDQTNRD